MISQHLYANIKPSINLKSFEQVEVDRVNMMCE